MKSEWCLQGKKGNTVVIVAFSSLQHLFKYWSQSGEYEKIHRTAAATGMHTVGGVECVVLYPLMI